MPCDTAGTGVDLIQSNTDSRSSDECYVAPGHGAQKTPTGYTGFICPADTYGRNQSVYGLQEVPCIKCPDNLFTYDPDAKLVNNKLDGRESVAACLTQPGWGYLDGDSYKCGYGAYNPGFNQVRLGSGAHAGGLPMGGAAAEHCSCGKAAPRCVVSGRYGHPCISHACRPTLPTPTQCAGAVHRVR